MCCSPGETILSKRNWPHEESKISPSLEGPSKGVQGRKGSDGTASMPPPFLRRTSLLTVAQSKTGQLAARENLEKFSKAGIHLD
jgi:hypothetical protein